MSHKKAKRLRKILFSQGINVSADSYTKIGSIIYASKPRRAYQKLKDIESMRRLCLKER